MEDAVQSGPVVIVGRGAQCLLARAAMRCTCSAMRRLGVVTEYTMKSLGLKADGSAQESHRR